MYNILNLTEDLLMKKYFAVSAALCAVLSAALLFGCAATDASSSDASLPDSETSVSTAATTTTTTAETTAPEEEYEQPFKLYNVPSEGENAALLEGSELTFAEAFNKLRAATADYENYFEAYGDQYAYRYEQIDIVNGKAAYMFSFGNDNEDKYTAGMFFCVTGDGKVSEYDYLSENYTEIPSKSVVDINRDVKNVTLSFVDNKLVIADAESEKMLFETAAEMPDNPEMCLVSVYISDYNFDGYDDICIPMTIGEVNGQYQYFLYNKDKKEFTRSEQLSAIRPLLIISPKNEVLYTCATESAAKYNMTYYSWEKDNLVPLRYAEVEYNDKTEKFALKLYNFDENGTKELESENEYTADEISEILER